MIIEKAVQSKDIVYSMYNFLYFWALIEYRTFDSTFTGLSWSPWRRKSPTIIIFEKVVGVSSSF